MIQIENKMNCSGCSACAQVCPRQCITMQADEEGFLYPKVDETVCIHCGLCEKICPVLHKKDASSSTPTAYAGYNKDESIRMQSSSGGLFTLFASAIIARGGVVFGAGFNEEFDVVHSYVETVDGLAKFRGSKYVQSKIGDTYKQAEEFLKQDRWVLFTGTPCQIGGLYAYLRKDYDKLLTQDIICHGVPSPLVWTKYKQYLTEKNKQCINNIYFRDKTEGWARFSMRIIFADGQEYRKNLSKDTMMQFFLRDLCLRPSCYNCSFKEKNRPSDITLADYWGINAISPEINDDKGISLLILNSPQGHMFFENIKDRIICKDTEIDRALFYNPAMIRSAKKPTNRDNFMRDINTKTIVELEKKYLFSFKPNLLRRVLSKIKRKLLRK